MKLATLNPPSNEREKEIWDFIKLAEGKIDPAAVHSNQESFVRGMKMIFNLFTYHNFD